MVPRCRGSTVVPRNTNFNKALMYVYMYEKNLAACGTRYTCPADLSTGRVDDAALQHVRDFLRTRREAIGPDGPISP